MVEAGREVSEDCRDVGFDVKDGTGVASESNLAHLIFDLDCAVVKSD